MRTTPSPPKQLQDQIQQHQPRPPLVLGSPLYKAKSSEKDIVVKEVIRQDNAVIIYWDTEATNILGFRVIYRLFGDNSFKQAPPLEASEREFKIKNVPSQVGAPSRTFRKLRCRCRGKYSCVQKCILQKTKLTKNLTLNIVT